MLTDQGSVFYFEGVEIQLQPRKNQINSYWNRKSQLSMFVQKISLRTPKDLSKTTMRPW